MNDSTRQDREWAIGVCVDEHDDHTRATAWLVGDTRDLTGSGVARRNPVDRDVPAIGDELAVARALHDLAEKLLTATAGDIEDVTHEHVRSLH
ncbi:DUF1876 domain-containing protein [Mycolicibacterium cosmeticum]|uniref:DUF1876 domain-containing protein n=1 Tax=Mycolicibacterium cosmeticum TaxID=258533 RepID=W9B8P0_MYCCO|nr:DUF1876 domain-containing protein [Mycolicibacterium cosmeticum]TLH74085.1 DUF1876 domain-containing protein [Mycolicibacterium cosmeticum]CDO11021.1 hypothetical protein BN977_05862 [Mycolicibacterium cosmeticum]